MDAAGGQAELFGEAQVALRRDIDARVTDDIYKSIEPFVWAYLRDYDIRDVPQLRATHLAGIREWLNDYKTNED